MFGNLKRWSVSDHITRMLLKRICYSLEYYVGVVTKFQYIDVISPLSYSLFCQMFFRQKSILIFFSPLRDCFSVSLCCAYDSFNCPNRLKSIPWEIFKFFFNLLANFYLIIKKEKKKENFEKLCLIRWKFVSFFSSYIENLRACFSCCMLAKRPRMMTHRQAHIEKSTNRPIRYSFIVFSQS